MVLSGVRAGSGGFFSCVFFASVALLRVSFRNKSMRRQIRRMSRTKQIHERNQTDIPFVVEPLPRRQIQVSSSQDQYFNNFIVEVIVSD